MSVEFDTSELDDLMAQFKASDRKAKLASSAAMTKIAADLADDARGSVPVDTGELKSSIRVQGGKDYRIVLADARHAMFVEFGTSDTAPQPYMWPHVPKASKALAEALEDIGPFD